MRYHYKPIRRMKIKKTHHPQYWWECGVTRTFMTAAETIKSYYLSATVWQFPTKLNKYLPYDTAIPCWGIYHRWKKKKKRYIHLKACSWMLLAAFLQLPKPGNNPNADQLGWMDKQIKWNTSMIKRNKLLIYAPIRINLKALF